MISIAFGDACCIRIAIKYTISQLAFFCSNAAFRSRYWILRTSFIGLIIYNIYFRFSVRDLDRVRSRPSKTDVYKNRPSKNRVIIHVYYIRYIITCIFTDYFNESIPSLNPNGLLPSALPARIVNLENSIFLESRATRFFEFLIFLYVKHIRPDRSGMFRISHRPSFSCVIDL